MLTQIELVHFKCFTILKLPLCWLTLLSGTNASGKSSVLQPLVALHQTIRNHEWSTRLALNGTAINLGRQRDVVNEVAGLKSCEIALIDESEGEEKEYRWKFGGQSTDLSLRVNQVRINQEIFNKPAKLHNLLPDSHSESPLVSRLRRLTYLTAERLGPRETYLLQDQELTPVIGSAGEHSAGILYANSDKEVLPNLVLSEGNSSTLLHQTTARMQHFFPDCELQCNSVSSTNAVTLGIRTTRETSFHRPIHTGFGLTQVFPIVVAALCAKPNDILLIENPEVHLHPAGQATMGQFMAEVAAAGVQVIVETHSDHVLNGIRRAVKSGTLSPDRTALHFFQSQSESEVNGTEQVQRPILDTNGNLDSWPRGFFDQFDIDMNYFAGWD